MTRRPISHHLGDRTVKTLANLVVGALLGLFLLRSCSSDRLSPAPTPQPVPRPVAVTTPSPEPVTPPTPGPAEIAVRGMSRSPQTGYDPAKKAERKAFVVRLEDQFLILDLKRRGPFVDAVAGPTWYKATHEQREALASVCYAWGLDGGGYVSAVRLFNFARKDREIARFSPDHGLAED